MARRGGLGAAPPAAARQGWLSRLKAGLGKTASGIASVFGGSRIDEALFEDLENALLMADTGVKATEFLLNDLKARVKASKATEPAAVKALLIDAITDMLMPLQKQLRIGDQKPMVLMVAGVNGAGKSTMMKILAGINQPTKGKVSCPKDSVVAYLPQHLLTEDNCTVFEETSKAFQEIFAMKDEIESINHQLTVRTDYESDEYMKLIERVSELSEKYYSIEEINYDGEVEKTLKGLGFSRSDMQRPTSQFSGGWRMRIELAKILLRKPDLILLDEPTNHLDIESIQWLEAILNNQVEKANWGVYASNLANALLNASMVRSSASSGFCTILNTV